MTLNATLASNGDRMPPCGVPLSVRVNRASSGARLAFTYGTDYGNGTIDPETVVSLTFAEVPGGTRLTLWHTEFQDVAVRDSHIGGWTTAVEKLKAFCGAGQ